MTLESLKHLQLAISRKILLTLEQTRVEYVGTMFGKLGLNWIGRALNTQLNSDFTCGLRLREGAGGAEQNGTAGCLVAQLQRCHSIVPSCPG